ncbi:hypothetical protein ACTOB_006568 [Actinoplanes oblitus]|uniref:Uncharacterized protein n=1 Tax=Actinoplanes oblitus TaxID=3040509 RepID=A0ABY8W9I6_9ACTN|nr:hypothetical protein [Actinoplanes oblitus]WIM94539.1 hypothetical protein ACTOB_006568 [Actinoplanes oblitus]
MEYQEAFPDLADVYLEDSWVLGIASTERDVAFQLDAVLTPSHPLYQPPAPGEQHCYRPARLSVSSRKLRLDRSELPAATDASGDSDFGNVDVVAHVVWDGEPAWEMSGDWGILRSVEPSVSLTFD